MMNTFKICVLSSVHRALEPRIFQKQCISLARAGYHVTLIAPHERDEEIDGVNIKKIPMGNYGRLYRMTCIIWRIYKDALRQDADIYHFHDPELIVVGLLLRARWKKVIFDIHEDIPASIVSKTYIPWFLRPPVIWMVEIVQSLLYKYFSALIAADPDVGEKIRDLNDVVVVVQNFPPFERLDFVEKESSEEKGRSLVYVGSISRARGIREIVDAMELLPEDLNVSLNLAGEFQSIDLYEEVKSLPGWKRVNYLGYLNRSEVNAVLRRSSLGLVILHPEPNYIHAYPTKMFEYMAASLPIIASDFPLWRQIIEESECGLLVDPLDPKAIADTIQSVISCPEEAGKMGKRGRKAMEYKYNWEGEERKLLQLYSSLLG